MEIIGAILVLFVMAVMMNLIAAGVSAILFLSARGLPFAGRMMISCTSFGVLLIIIGLVGSVFEGQAGLSSLPITLLSFAIVAVITGIFSLPGALMVGRRLERSLIDTRAFD